MDSDSSLPNTASSAQLPVGMATRHLLPFLLLLVYLVQVDSSLPNSAFLLALAFIPIGVKGYGGMNEYWKGNPDSQTETTSGHQQLFVDVDVDFDSSFPSMTTFSSFLPPPPDKTCVHVLQEILSMLQPGKQLINSSAASFTSGNLISLPSCASDSWLSRCLPPSFKPALFCGSGMSLSHRGCGLEKTRSQVVSNSRNDDLCDPNNNNQRMNVQSRRCRRWGTF